MSEHGELVDNSETPQKALSSAVPFTTAHMEGGLKKRRLTTRTLSKFSYFVDAEGLQVANLYDQKGNLAQQKYRTASKDFFFKRVSEDSTEKPHELKLFGQQVYGDKYDKKVVITEGEIDAMSVAQALDFKVAAAVSVPAGTGSAIKAVQANYRWLDRFEQVIFWMDNDAAGQGLVDELCALFPGKSYTIKVEGFKDASDILQADRPGDILGAVYGAVSYSPEGIVNARDASSDMLEPEGEKVADYPFPLLNAATYGIREGEVVYHVAGTGVGKTSQMVEIQAKLLEDNIKFGVIRFEDTRRKAQLDIMSVAAGIRLHLTPLPKDEMLALHASTFGGGGVELFDPEKAKWDLESILGYIRYMVLGLKCKVVFVDPLSFVVSGANERDERKAIDLVSYEFARLVKHTRANMQVAHHLRRAGEGKGHEEGGDIFINQLRGSGGIANYSMAIIGYKRNLQGLRPDLTQSLLLKNRFAGTTGIMDTLKFDEITGRSLPTSEEFPTDDDRGTGGVPKGGFGREEQY
jgi:twinkle protein